MDLQSGIARTIFCGMIKTDHFVIAETVTWPNYCSLMNLLMHLGLDVEGIRTYSINLAIHKYCKVNTYSDANNRL